MRLAAAACALAVVGAVAAAGIVVSQKFTISGPTPAAATPAAETVTPTESTSAPTAHDTPLPAVMAEAGATIADAEATTAQADQTQAAAPAAPSEPTSPPARRVAQASAAAPPPPPAPPPPTPAVARPTCSNPNALGVSRTVEIDTTGAPGFGFEHFKMYDFLQPGEVVLTFDDGPWPNNTEMVLKALAKHCTKATFFSIGKHASYHPEILKEVAAAGHTVGSHTWSHADLSKKTTEEGIDEIEHGISAVHIALEGLPEAPFIRFPALRHPPELLKYLATRNIAVFSTDIDSFDFKLHKPEQVIKSVMARLKKRGKGIVLMHDFQRSTAHAAEKLLDELKADGYKIVHMRPKAPVKTLPKYDQLAMKDFGLGAANARPMSSVVRTISR